jgi:hypothetical protein
VPCSSPLLTQLGKEGTEALLAEPELQQTINTVTGQRGASQCIDLMTGIRAGRIDTALDDLDDRLAGVVEQRFARPQALPFRIVDLTAETRGFCMLIETETDDGIEIRLDGEEAMQRGPQAVAADRQDQ